jgi:hypothetical protein
MQTSLYLGHRFCIYFIIRYEANLCIVSRENDFLFSIRAATTAFLQLCAMSEIDTKENNRCDSEFAKE